TDGTVGARRASLVSFATDVSVGAQPVVPLQIDPAATLLTLLAHPDIRSKETVVRLYDHEVQGGTAIKPLVGAADHGHGDAAVIVPLGTPGTKAVALSAGIAPAYTTLDPYAMAWAAVDEAFRNLVAVGADPDQVALLDNFCWGSPYLPDRLGALVRNAQGCYDAALAYGAPFISGKDSLNNEYTDVDGTRHAIPGTLLISALGLVPDVEHTITSALKQSGDLLYLIGATRDEFGGSHFNLIRGIDGGTVPQPVSNALATYRKLYQAISSGLVRGAHDCSEGGIAVALAEMCIGGRRGANASFDFAAKLLFSESQGRLIVEVAPENAAAFEQALAGQPLQKIGTVTDDEALTIAAQGADLHLNVAILESTWRDQSTTVGARHVVPLQNQHEAHRSIPTPFVHPSPRVLILHANGSNRDHEAALACELAGGAPEIVHVNQLVSGERSLLDYHMLVVPGGFSYGDDLGAGTLWALDLRRRFGADMERFVAEGRPVLGICNGFQALVKSGLLPGEGERKVTLTNNASTHFECRWVYLQPNPNSACLFTEGLTEPIYCPVAHGEGRLAVSDPSVSAALWSNGLVALTYVEADGSPAGYPANPNGSVDAIAGLSNRAGNVFGLMPHPEDHVFIWQHPRREDRMDGLRLFRNGIKYA
ncbi:MAG TPA: phosphoribosylformylglycinamidine synthase I, partial [Phototrophicaceae bacterium]|nr:phosphoribosylformylglycinamidine synthase I [Phototrophicaceae bacterium]